MHVMMRIFTHVGLAFSILSIGGVLVTDASGWQLPSYMNACWLARGDYSIDTPDAQIDRKFTRFLGGYTGKWGQQIPHTLLVTSANNEGHARLIYAWGSYGPWNVRPGCESVNGQITDDTIVTTLGNGATVRYVRNSDGSLEGTWSHPEQGRNSGTFAREYMPDTAQ